MLIGASEPLAARPTPNDERHLGWHGQAWQQAFEQALVEQGGGHRPAGDTAAVTSPAAGTRAGAPEPTDGTAHAAVAGGVSAAGGAGAELPPAVQQPSRLDGQRGTAPIPVLPAVPGTYETANRTDAVRSAGGWTDPTGRMPLFSWPLRGPMAPFSTRPAAPESTEAAPVRALMAPAAQPGPTHLFVEHTRDGAVLWVRDATADAAAMRTVVAAVLREAEARAVPIVSVRLNGAAYALSANVHADRRADAGPTCEPGTFFIPPDPTQEP